MPPTLTPGQTARRALRKPSPYVLLRILNLGLRWLSAASLVGFAIALIADPDWLVFGIMLALLLILILTWVVELLADLADLHLQPREPTLPGPEPTAR